MPVDPSYPEERICHILNDSKCKVILTEDKNAEILGCCQGMFPVADIRHIQEAKTSNPHISVSPHHLSYVIYTSGSTGLP